MSATFDKSAFEALFNQHFTGLVAFARKFIKDQDSSTEIVHDVFVNLWNKRETMDPEKNLKSYLFTSVHNRCLNYIRDNKKFDRNNEDLGAAEDIGGADASELMEAAELDAKIQAAIRQLPGKCAEIFILNRFEGKKYREIADQLGIAQKTVEAQMSKALKLMRGALEQYLHLFIVLFANFFEELLN